MDRMDEVLQCGEREFAAAFSKSMIFLQEEYQKERYWKSAKEAIEGAVSAAAPGENKRYLGILYLDSSILTKSYELLIMQMDERMYLDPFPIETYWRPLLFFEEYERDIQTAFRTVERIFRHIQPFERQEVSKKCAVYLYAAIYKLLECIKERLDIPDHVSLFFGRYRGSARMIRERSGKGI